MTHAPPILDYQSPRSTPPPPGRMIPIFEGCLHIAFGVILPIVCFALSAKEYPAADRVWQSGQLRVYVGLIPRAACAWPFYPFLLYSMLSLSIAVVAPRFAAARFPVRLGIYTGVILALQFCVIQVICFDSNPVVIFIGLLGTPALVGMYELLRWLIRRFRGVMKRLGLLIGVLAGIAVLVTLMLGRHAAFLLLPGLLILMIAPMLTLASYLAVSRLMLFEGEHTRLASLWLWIPWSGGYSLAWWASIACVLDEYARLPKAAPGGCYVVSAAAGGHPRFVRSKRVVCNDGSIVAINAQLRRLRCAEILLACAAPEIHLRLRIIYDRVGPRLARLIRTNPLLCDLAYCSLKPAEWTVIVAVRAALTANPALASAVLTA